MTDGNQVQAPTAKTGGVNKKVILIVVGVLIIVGLGGAAVYARYFSKPGSFLSSVVPKALNPNCKYNDPDLCKFMNNWPNIADLTMTMNSTTAGKTSVLVFKQSGKNKTEMVSKTDGKEDLHTISIDKTDYYLDFTDNKWWKFTPTATDGSTLKSTEKSIDFNSPEDKSTYKKIGKEACGNLSCFKYQVIDPANTDSTEYIYFDDKEYLLRKTRDESKDGSVFESLVSYESVSISAPSPTKDGNPYSAGGVNTTIPTTAPTTSTPSSSSSNSTSVQTPASSDTPTVDTTPTDTSGDTPVDTTPTDNSGQ